MATKQYNTAVVPFPSLPVQLQYVGMPTAVESEQCPRSHRMAGTQHTTNRTTGPTYMVKRVSFVLQVEVAGSGGIGR